MKITGRKKHEKKQTAKRIFVLVMAFLLANSLTSGAPLGGQQAFAATVTVTNETSLRAAVQNAANGDVIDLGGATITLNNSLDITKNLTFTNGTLLVNGSFRHIYVGSACTELILDATLEGRRSGYDDLTTLGGGISMMGSGTITLKENGVITNCFNSGSGGAINAPKAKLVMDGGAVTNNAAEGNNNGGGVCVDTLEMSSGTISDNRLMRIIGDAAHGGGGVYVASSVFMTGGTISGNSVEPSVTNSLRGAGSGGGIFVGKGNGTVSITGGTISNNYCTATGGGIYAEEGVKVTIGGSAVISENHSGQGGGGVHARGTVIVQENAQISGNLAQLNGGGIQGNVVVIEGGTISGNTAPTGGGVSAINTFNMSGGTVSANTAIINFGGGVFISSRAEGTISGGTISGNTAPTGGGIALNAYAQLTVDSGAISNNTASENGGGIHLLNTGAALTMNGGELSGNETEGNGGGIHAVPKTKVAINAGDVTNNTAGGDGGGIYVPEYTILTTGTGANFAENSASSSHAWNLGDYGMDLQTEYYEENILSTTMTPVEGSDNILNNYDVNFSLPKSEPPNPADALVGDTTVGGTGIAGSLITVTFPYFPDFVAETIVDEAGNWTSEIPVGGTDYPFVSYKATQTEPGKQVSDPAEATVLPKKLPPPTVDNYYLDSESGYIIGAGKNDLSNYEEYDDDGNPLKNRGAAISIFFPDGSAIWADGAITKTPETTEQYGAYFKSYTDLTGTAEYAEYVDPDDFGEIIYVGSDGTWSVAIPDWLTLEAGQAIYASQFDDWYEWIESDRSVGLVYDTIPTYNVTYEANYPAGSSAQTGSVPADSASYAAGSVATVLGNVGASNDPLVVPGYTFAGWNENTDATTAQYRAGNTFAMPDENVVLYAVWTQDKYTVSYLPGEQGTFEVQTTADLTYGADTPAAPETPGNPGYSFSGWSPVVTGTVEKDVEYVAQWTQDKYTVSYLPGEQGTFEVQTTTDLTYGADTPAAPETLGNPGYSFSGWSPVVVGTVDGDAQYVAQWTPLSPVTYTVSYLPGDHGTFGIVIISGLHYGDATPQAPDTTQAESGWVFAGWDKTPTQTVTGNAEYTAQWSKKDTDDPKPTNPVKPQDPETYTVSYLPGDHGIFKAKVVDGLYSGDPTPQAPDTTQAESGWIFTGWDKTPTKTVTSSVKYVAQWKQEEYKVVYKPGDHGTFKTTTTSGLHYGDATPQAPDTTKAESGWVFTGWDKTPTQTVTGDAEYTAQWSKKDTEDPKPQDSPKPQDPPKPTDPVKPQDPETYTVSYLPGYHGTFKAKVVNGLYSGDPTPQAPDTTQAESGWIFIGWDKTPTQTVTGDVEYTAQWIQVLPPAEPKITITPGVVTTPEAPEIVITPEEPKTYVTIVPAPAPEQPEITVVRPDIPSTVLDVPTPLTNVVPNPLPSGSDNTGTLFGDPIGAAWALVNLILAIIGVIAAIIVTLYAMRKRRNEKEDQDKAYDEAQAQNQDRFASEASEENEDDDENERKAKRVLARWLIVAAVLAVISVIVFLLTEDWRNPMILVDRWTIVNAIILLLEIIALRLAFRKKQYTVSYLPGDHGTFEAVITEDLHYGDDTPEAPESTSGEVGWMFTGWSETPTDTVKGTVEYVAQWSQGVYQDAQNENSGVVYVS
jgi:uncharacterized repeat protein (TIGR02543 family)